MQRLAGRSHPNGQRATCPHPKDLEVEEAVAEVVICEYKEMLEVALRRSIRVAVYLRLMAHPQTNTDHRRLTTSSQMPAEEPPQLQHIELTVEPPLERLEYLHRHHKTSPEALQAREELAVRLQSERATRIRWYVQLPEHTNYKYL